MEIWDPLIGALVGQLISMVAAEVRNVRVRRVGGGEPPALPGSRCVEIRIIWRAARTGGGEDGPDSAR